MGEKKNDQTINIKLCYRIVNNKQRFHVNIPDGARFEREDFLKLKDHLRRTFSDNNYNKALYLAGTPRWFEEGQPKYTRDQPVFEYGCKLEEIREAITDFTQTSLKFKDRKFSYSTIDYDFVSAMKEVPLDMIHEAEALDFVE